MKNSTYDGELIAHLGPSVHVGSVNGCTLLWQNKMLESPNIWHAASSHWNDKRWNPSFVIRELVYVMVDNEVHRTTTDTLVKRLSTAVTWSSPAAVAGLKVVPQIVTPFCDTYLGNIVHQTTPRTISCLWRSFLHSVFTGGKCWTFCPAGTASHIAPEVPRAWGTQHPSPRK